MMKTYTLLIALFLSVGPLFAEEPAPKLVPRPIPGLPSLPANDPEPIPNKRPQATTVIPATLITTDRARILAIHRRASLPVEFTRDLPAPQAQPAASTHLQLRQSAVKIIPKTEVAEHTKSKD